MLGFGIIAIWWSGYILLVTDMTFFIGDDSQGHCAAVKQGSHGTVSTLLVSRTHAGS